MKKIASIFMSLVMFFSMAVSIFCGSVSVSAEEDYRGWAQHDSRWENVIMGGGTANVGKYGCLAVSITKLIIQCGAENSASFTPKTFVEKANNAGIFGSGGALNWDTLKKKIPSIVQGMTVEKVNITYSSDEVIRAVMAGKYVIVRGISPNNSSSAHFCAVDNALTIRNGYVTLMNSSRTIANNINVDGDKFFKNKIKAYYVFSYTSPCNHASTYLDKGYCSKCKRWLPNQQDARASSSVQYKVTTATNFVQHPYAYSKDAYSSVGDYKPIALSVGQYVDVYGYVINGFGNKWYCVKYNGVDGYIYNERLTCECECSSSYAGEYTCTSTTSLVIHSDHSWNSETKIGTIPSGATCKVTKSDGKYAHVVYNGISGIAAMNYLKKKTSSSTSTPASCDCSDSVTGLYYCTASSSLVIHSDHSYNSDTKIGGIPSLELCFVTKKSKTKTYTHIIYDGIEGIVSWNYLAPVDSWGISVVGLPDKTVYDLGEPFEQAGLRVHLSYSFSYSNINGEMGCSVGSVNIYSNYTLSGFDSSTPGEKRITVNCFGKTASFTVTVRPAALTNVSLYTQPTKTVYSVGDTLDTNGLKLRLTYADGREEIISNGYYADGFDSSTPGTKQIEIEYDGFLVHYNATVEQPERPVVHVSLKGDADGDGKITSTDARLALQLSVGKIQKKDLYDGEAIDIDGDGNITSTDARLILQYAVKKITRWPAIVTPSSVVGLWTYVDENNSLSSCEPQVEFSGDNTFRFTANLYEGIGHTTGSYTVSGDKIICRVTSIDFRGFSGDNVYEYVFRIKNGELIYEGEPIGATSSGCRFSR